MSLVARCVQIELLNRERRDQERQGSRLGAVQAHWASVNRELGLLSTGLASISFLAGEGVLVGGLPQAVVIAKNSCLSLGKQVEDDAELNLQGRAFTEVAEAVRLAQSELQSHISSQWRSFVAKHAPAIRSAEVEADRTHLDPVRKKAANDLFGVLSAYERVVAVVPTCPRDFQAYEGALATVGPALVAYRSAADLPRTVEAFFKKANGAQGASLTDLSPDIAAWLHANGRQHLFCIRATNG